MYNYILLSSQSSHNKAVLANLAEQVTKDPENTFPAKTVSCKLLYIFYNCIQDLVCVPTFFQWPSKGSMRTTEDS